MLQTSCNTNCGGRCVINAHVKDGTIVRLAQAAAGLYLAVVLVRECLAASKDGGGVAGALKATRIPALVAGVMLAIGVVISLAHLGTPMGAYRALGNLGGWRLWSGKGCWRSSRCPWGTRRCRRGSSSSWLRAVSRSLRP